MSRVIIFANGEIPDLKKARALLQPDDYIICADGGSRHALALNLKPDLVIGDMDSIQKSHWQRLKKSGISIELFPRDKNETDLELAVHRAIDMKREQIVIIAGLGGRLDQTLGNISLLADTRLSSSNIRLDDGVEEVILCRDQAQIQGRTADIVSLIPWQGTVTGVQTKDLKWPLTDESLYPDKTRGISNEMIGETASVSIRSGSLLIVHRRA